MRTACLLLTLWNPTGSCHWGMFCNSWIQTSGIFLDPEVLWNLLIPCLNIRTQCPRLNAITKFLLVSHQSPHSFLSTRAWSSCSFFSKCPSSHHTVACVNGAELWVHWWMFEGVTDEMHLPEGVCFHFFPCEVPGYIEKGLEMEHLSQNFHLC